MISSAFICTNSKNESGTTRNRPLSNRPDRPHPWAPGELPFPEWGSFLGEYDWFPRTCGQTPQSLMPLCWVYSSPGPPPLSWSLPIPCCCLKENRNSNVQERLYQHHVKAGKRWNFLWQKWGMGTSTWNTPPIGQRRALVTYMQWLRLSSQTYWQVNSEAGGSFEGKH